MGFARQGLWVMGYCRLMGYGLQIPAHQLGGTKWVWDFRGYGLSGAWVKRVSTVCEIGSRAFALILTHNPKIYEWSLKCILVGYSPHSKAYWLYHPTTHRLFKSFHVKFIKHKDDISRPLYPGHVIDLPSTDSSPGCSFRPNFSGRFHLNGFHRVWNLLLSQKCHGLWNLGIFLYFTLLHRIQMDSRWTP